MIYSRFTRLKSGILFIPFTLLCWTSSTAQEVTLEIDTSAQYQVIDNFGASDCWSFQKIGAWPSSKKELVADLLFSMDKGIGLSAWRFNIGGGEENNRISHPWRSVETFEISEGVYDWTRQSNEVWFLHAAKARGVAQFIAFVNSPPARMTKSGYTNCNDGLGSTNLKDGYEGQFAAYLADILEHFRDDEGIAFDYISPVNEPIWEWNNSNQEGNRASNADIKNIVSACYSTFQNRRLETEIMIPECGDLPAWYTRAVGISNKYGKMYGNYLIDICKDTTVNYKISKNLCGHSYWSERLDTEILQHRSNLNLVFSPYFNQGWKYWMSEYCQLEGPNGEGGGGRDLSMTTALNVARIIHFDLAVANASAWQWWTAVSPENYKDGLIYTDYFEPGDFPSILQSKTLWALGNYSRFIRPGSVRIECSGASDRYNVMASGYLDRADSCIIIVAVNVSNAAYPVSFNFKNLPGSSAITPYITSDQAGYSLKEGTAFSSDEQFNLPAKSVVTFVRMLGNTTGIENGPDSAPGEQNMGNYPNPFNSDTTISYTVKRDGRIVIELFDLRGRKIETLLDEVKPAGNYRLNYSAQNLSSGKYMVRIHSNQSVQFKNFVFMK
ncbi:T9SS type A sorting domain-containing protein [bacterium]|nr:T9SS type A sorting domain-containing protein [bacterium]